jgi:S-DNA-T family DNA segregation ATPase FtsK/SpoIIIE
MIRAIYVQKIGIGFIHKKIELKICSVVLKYLYTMSDYETTIRAIMQIPFVKDLRKENKSLRREIKALKNLIYSLPEFRCRCAGSRGSSHTQTVEFVDHNVNIKTEPGLEPTPCDTLTDDDDVVYVEKSRETENIVYVIDDHEVDVQVTRIHTEIQKPRDIVVVKAQADTQDDAQAGAQASDEEEEEAQASEEEEADEEEEASEEEEEEEEEAELVDKEQEEEEGEVYEITIAGKQYYTTNGQNGKIYAVDADEEVGDEIGVFVNGKATFYKKK